MTGHTPTPATCRQLTDAGFPVQSPILSQIIQQLPRNITDDYGLTYYLTIVPSPEERGWSVGYRSANLDSTHQTWTIEIRNNSLLEATAQLWLRLKDMGVLT